MFNLRSVKIGCQMLSGVSFIQLSGRNVRYTSNVYRTREYYYVLVNTITYSLHQVMLILRILVYWLVGGFVAYVELELLTQSRSTTQQMREWGKRVRGRCNSIVPHIMCCSQLLQRKYDARCGIWTHDKTHDVAYVRRKLASLQ